MLDWHAQLPISPLILGSLVKHVQIDHMLYMFAPLTLITKDIYLLNVQVHYMQSRWYY